MREAAIPGYRLSKAKFSTRVLITCAIVGLLLGLFSATALTVSRTGLTPNRVAAYYLGESAETLTPESDPWFHSEPRPLEELVEVTHLHLMGGSLMLFLLCHLLSICDVSEKFRATMYLVSFCSFLLTFGSPWLIIYANRAFSLMYAPSIFVFLLSLVSLCLIPLWEMWIRTQKS